MLLVYMFRESSASYTLNIIIIDIISGNFLLSRVSSEIFQCCNIIYCYIIYWCFLFVCLFLFFTISVQGACSAVHTLIIVAYKAMNSLSKQSDMLQGFTLHF